MQSITNPDGLTRTTRLVDGNKRVAFLAADAFLRMNVSLIDRDDDEA